MLTTLANHLSHSPMNKPFLLSFTVCAIVILIFALYKNAISADNSVSLNFRSADPPHVFAYPISDTLAYKMFHDYHQSNGPQGSKGVLKTDGRAIFQFYIDQEQLIEPMKAKATSLGKEFLGLSAIPGFNAADSSHTIIWVAVVDGDPSNGVRHELMLPKAGEKWTDYIYDHVIECPDMCPENSVRLWNEFWAE